MTNNDQTWSFNPDIMLVFWNRKFKCFTDIVSYKELPDDMTFLLFPLTGNLKHVVGGLAVIKFTFVIGIIETRWSNVYNYYEQLESLIYL